MMGPQGFTVSPLFGKEECLLGEVHFQSIMFSPFPVQSFPFAVEINVGIYERDLRQTSAPYLTFSVVILTGDIWEHPY